MNDLALCPVCSTPCTVERNARGETPDWIRYASAIDYSTWQRAINRHNTLVHDIRVALRDYRDYGLNEAITIILDLFDENRCSNCGHNIHPPGCEAGAHPFGATDHVDCGCPKNSCGDQMQPSELGRALAVMQRRSLKPCAVCGKAANMRARQKYCSNACRCKAYQQRKRK